MTTLSLKKKYCKSCFEEIKCNCLHELLNKDICICQKCLKEMDPKLIKIKIQDITGFYLYHYNDFIKGKIYTLKGCGDIELSSIFLNYYLPYLKMKFAGYSLVAAPSNKEADLVRGFNHVKEIFKPLKLPFLDCIEKKIDFKQSDLNKKEREKIYEKLILKNTNLITNKKILFVDDISTTGSTLKACLKLIKQGNPKKINFLIIAKRV